MRHASVRMRQVAPGVTQKTNLMGLGGVAYLTSWCATFFFARL